MMSFLVLQLRRYGPPLATLIFLVFLWEIMAWFYEVPEWLLPAPSDIYLAGMEFRSLLPRHTFATVHVTVIGFLAAAAIGFLMAVMLTASDFLMRTLYPILLSLQSMPKIAIAPLLLMWVGFGPGSKIIIVFLVCFFPIVVSTITGLQAPPKGLLDIGRSFSTPSWRMYRKIKIPYSIPYFFIGLKVSVVLAVTGAVVGEFVAAREGLGFLILNGVQQFNTPLAFAAIVILSLVTLIFYAAVSMSERLLVRWRV